MASPEPDDDAAVLSKEIPSLERLVSYFVASKTSLSAVNHVWRANEIVAASKTSLEKLATLHSKNSFLTESINRQLQTAKAIRHGLTLRRDGAHTDFKNVLRTLDEVDTGVKHILEILKGTFAESSLRPEEITSKCLYDFVDEQGLDDLRSFFRSCIDHTSDAQTLMGNVLDEFDGKLREIQAALNQKPQWHGDRDHSIANTATMFHSLEEHATEMAELLQSLVRHYDLSMTALKHTEGGNEAAEGASGDLPEGVNVSGPEHGVPPKPISEEEKLEMLKVLANDAAEVDDVVQEIRDHVSEMEFQLEHITNQLHMVESEHESIKEAIKLLRDLGQDIPNYIEESSLFVERWEEQKARIQGRMEELEGVRQFYERFLSAYDSLIIEIARRKRVKSTVDRLVANAMSELQKIHEADYEEREAFKDEQGPYLPSDLWPGYMTEPARYELTPVQQSSETLPDISKEVLQQALTRTGRSTKK